MNANNEKNYDDVFKSLLKLLQSIRPGVPLPDGLPPLLWSLLSNDITFREETVLEEKDRKPKHAYYVIKGYVKVYAWGLNGYRYLFRIYRPGTIVALMDFIDQNTSEYELVACRKSTVRKISIRGMEQIYATIPGMKEFAYNTALSYNQYKEKLYRDLQALEDVDDRVLAFYRFFPGMLPAQHAVIRSVELAGFLGLSDKRLVMARRALKEELGKIMGYNRRNNKKF